MLNALGLANEDIEYVRRVGKLPNDESPGPRPLVITVRTPEMAAALHGHGRGRKFTDNVSGVDTWCNPDLIAADRKANYLARQERNKRKQKYNNTDRTTAGRTRRGSFLPSSQPAPQD